MQGLFFDTVHPLLGQSSLVMQSYQVHTAIAATLSMLVL